MSERLEKYIDSLSRMINIPTVSDAAFPNEEEFAKFRVLLRELFPNMFASFIYEEFGGAILLSHIVDGDDEPVLFMSHHDVVSENGKWAHEPFNAVVEDEKLYGRGTLDTKGNLWAILTAAEELLISLNLSDYTYVRYIKDTWIYHLLTFIFTCAILILGLAVGYN